MIHPSPKIFEKDFGLCKKKEKKCMLKSMIKKRRDSPSLKKSQKGERRKSDKKGVHVPSTISTIYTHVHILIRLYDSLLPRIRSST